MSLKEDSGKKIRKKKAQWKIDTVADFEQMEDTFLKERLLSKEPTIKGTVRVTGGQVKNFNIEIPRNTRPLTDRMKVRIFDILAKDIANKTVLDLYAGSGSFGIESLSRGAKSATFVDASKYADIVLKHNIEKTGYTSNSEVIKMKVDEFLLKNVTKEIGSKWENGNSFDIIFIDPPYKLYNKKQLYRIEHTITEAGKLLTGVHNPKARFKGVVIMKHPRHYPIEKLNPEGLKLLESLEFGLNSITIYILTKK